MRYAAISAVVFSGAMFTVPGNHVPANGTPKTITTLKNPPASITQIFSAPGTATAHTTGLPRVKLAAAPHKNPVPVAISATVQPGDSLTAIAAANATTVQKLFDANPAVKDPNSIQPGQELRVPSPNETLPARPMPLPAVAVSSSVQSTAATTTYRASTPAVASAAAVAGGSVWDSLAQCESGGNWAINTGNGFYGGLQFTLATWQGLGGTGLPSQASREEQIARAETLQARSGWGQWPACTAKLGLR